MFERVVPNITCIVISALELPDDNTQQTKISPSSLYCFFHIHLASRMAKLLRCVTYAFLTFFPLSEAYQSPGRPCPIPCNVAGNSPSNWTDLHGVTALKRCKEPVLFDTALFTPIDDPVAPLTLRSCTASGNVVTQEIEYKPAPFTFGSPIQRRRTRRLRTIDGPPIASIAKRQATNSTNTTSLQGCTDNADAFQIKMTVNLLTWDLDDTAATGDAKSGILSASKALEQYLSNQNDCDSTVMMARQGDAVVGLYVGAEVVTSSARAIMSHFISVVQKGEDVSALSAQVCPDKAPATWLVGIYADFSGNLLSTQEALKSWAKGKCLGGSDRTTTGEDTEMSFVRATGVPFDAGLFAGYEQVSKPIDPRVTKRKLVVRDECKPIQVGSGDGCWSLAQRCGVTQKDFESYNPRADLCDPIKGVQPKQWVCCSKGDLPDMGPKPNPDGSCATYVVQPKDECWLIAEQFGIKTDRIDELNKKTWGWGGCGAIQPGDKFCVSKGDPPMPAERSNAVCGPQVPGTQRPSDGTDIKDLNPCPLNVCCNVWGQCGTTDDFCVPNPADTGAPGTTKPGKNSCVSSCGMNITNNANPPAQFTKIAYFEAWNHQRPCLHMDVTDIDVKKFTHIHFAFPEITPDFNVNVTGMQDQFDKLKNMKDIKRIVSFGGWAFSTEAPTYNIFRDGVTDANRITLANNVAQFVNDNNLDGVDFDWEYPSAPDIPGIPASVKEAGKQYLEFLKAVKRRTPKKSVSIAAPASYWYLKGFPIKEIGAVVDYIVYMTYDLHGQWDYGNKWSSPGCEEGDCLRSHINITETTTSLAMITKAGVEASKVIVGVASYGRSFHMKDYGCDGPMCRFTGSATESEALPGRCTETSGYISNAEIREIIANYMGGTSSAIKSWHDTDSNTDMLVYGDLEWIAFMSDKTKESRTNWVKGLNFGGTSDWAVDLDRDYGSEGVGDTNPEDMEMGGGPQCDQADTYTNLEKIADATSLAPTCAQAYALKVLAEMLDGCIEKYRKVNDGYDSKFQSYIKHLKKGLPESLRLYAHYLDGPGQQFFDCTFDGNGKKWSGKCPVPDSVRGNLLIGVWKITMTLRDSDGFYKDLNEKTGILKDWVEFYTFKETTGGFCQSPPCNPLDLTINGLPRLKKEYTVPNPKDIVEKAMGNQQNLVRTLNARAFDVGMGIWMGSNADAVQALAIPVFLVENAIEGMEDAKELGEDAEKEDAKNKLLLILSLVFLIVPFLGEAAAIAAGAATMARVIALIGAGANAGLTLHEVIENPEMAPFAIMELLTAGRLKAPKDYTDAVKFRTAMSKDALASLGTKFVKQDEQIQKIVRACKKK
jgi:chitinase